MEMKYTRCHVLLYNVDVFGIKPNAGGGEEGEEKRGKELEKNT